MIWIALSILLSSVVVLLFKVFDRYGIDTFRGIVVNYGVCCLMGTLLADDRGFWPDVFAQPWFFYALLLGVLFIIVFNAIGAVAQRIAVSVSMVSAKMSLIIPVLFACFFLGERLSGINIFGIALSLPALYFTTRRETEHTKAVRFAFLLPLLVFAGSGAIDMLMKYIEVTYLHHTGIDQVLAVVFGTACICGLLWMLLKPGAGGRRIGKHNLPGGIMLGLPNYFSMYFLFKALHQPQMPATVVFPLNNIAIVLLSALLALLFFGEKLSRTNLLGITLAIVSIFFISIS